MRTRTLSIAALSAALFAPAAASAAGPAPLGFGIKAIDAPKGYFVFKSHPGARVHGSFQLANLTNRRRVVYLREADAFTAQAGGVEFTQQGNVPIHAGTWFTIDRHTVVLRPNQTKSVGISGEVPAGASAGDHLAGVIAYGKRPARTAGKGNFGFRLLSRLAVAVQFTLPGERVTGLDVQGVDINVSPVGAVLQLDLANSGNSLIKTTTGRLHVTKDGRPLFSPKVKLGTFVPKTETRYPLPWPGTPVEGTYHVSGVLRPRGAPPVRIDTDVKFGKTRIREFRQETGRQAVETSRTPVWIWALLGLALAAVLALLLLLLRSRRRGDDDHVAATRPPSYPPPVELAHIPVPSMREHVPVAVADVPFSGGGGDDGLVDLNTATVEELTQLPGIGPRAADRIVAHREEYGRFESVEGLCAVEGFDKKRIRGLDEHATV